MFRIKVKIYIIPVGTAFDKAAAKIASPNGAMPFIPLTIESINDKIYTSIFCFVNNFFRIFLIFKTMILLRFI